ncbi:MAG: FG-GAP repeat protein, partial [Granulosicoccus sp.]|nr:FG-GAP repeat protein [Granulosicoccus sp.]
MRGFPNSIPDATIDTWKATLADWIKAYWTTYDQLGFKSPAFVIDDDGSETFNVTFINESGRRGRLQTDANNEPTGDLNIWGPDLGNGNAAETNKMRAVVFHELFHGIQYNHVDRDTGTSVAERYGSVFFEGTAYLVPALVDQALGLEFVSGPSSCDKLYLSDSSGRMWFRTTGGARFNARYNVCATALWWRYLTQQLSSSDDLTISRGVDTLNRLLQHLEPSTGWRQRAGDTVNSTGDFNGDGLDDLLVTGTRHLGILSPMLYNPTTLGIVADTQGTFGGHWRYHSTDVLSESCDITGNGRSEFLIQSNTHL